ncbi:hypothetical protein GCM10028792_27330 [Salinisphaera aquimarina]
MAGLRLAASIGLSGLGCLLLAMMAANAWVVSATRDHIFDDIDRLGAHDVGVVLGTSPYTRYGNRNLLFTHRMIAAAELYAAGRVRHLLVSGANPDSTYNEPRKMYQALRRLGVPDAALTLDFAGFRTLDSIVRAKRIFGLDNYVIVSQRYHDYRALFIARYNGIHAVAYSRPEEDRRQPLRAEAREYLARVKAVVDLFLLSTRPRFLGPPRPIEIEPVEPFDFLIRSELIDPDGMLYGKPPSPKEAGDAAGPDGDTQAAQPD